MSEWISVEDRLPDAYTDVIFFGSSKSEGEPGVYFGYRGDTGNYLSGGSRMRWYDKGSREDELYGYDELTFVTHWMPLPEPPK
jgi:hypothetical protein